jgi:hypothetical protein
MLGCFPKAASRRYVINVLVAMSLYVVALVVSLCWLHHNPEAPWKFIIAAIPVLPILWIPVAVVRLFRELDELQKQVQLEALAFGFAGAAALTLTYGFLQNAGLPDLSWIWVWPVMAICWIVGLAVARRRYR